MLVTWFTFFCFCYLDHDYSFCVCGESCDDLWIQYENHVIRQMQNGPPLMLSCSPQKHKLIYMVMTYMAMPP